MPAEILRSAAAIRLTPQGRLTNLVSCGGNAQASAYPLAESAESDYAHARTMAPSYRVSRKHASVSAPCAAHGFFRKRVQGCSAHRRRWERVESPSCKFELLPVRVRFRRER